MLEKFIFLRYQYTNCLEDFQDLEHVNKSLVTILSESHALIDSLKSKNLVLGSKVDLLENKLKESKTRLEKFSSNSLKNMMHTKNSDCDEFELSFDYNDSIFKIMFVKLEKVEDSLVERNKAAAPTSQCKKGTKIHIEPCVFYPKNRVVHPPRNLSPQRFIPTCHYCNKIGHIRPNCFKLKPCKHKKKISYSKKEPLGLCTVMIEGLSRLDKIENIHISTPPFKKVWVKKDYTIHLEW